MNSNASADSKPARHGDQGLGVCVCPFGSIYACALETPARAYVRTSLLLNEAFISRIEETLLRKHASSYLSDRLSAASPCVPCVHKETVFHLSQWHSSVTHQLLGPRPTPPARVRWSLITQNPPAPVRPLGGCLFFLCVFASDRLNCDGTWYVCLTLSMRCTNDQ